MALTVPQAWAETADVGGSSPTNTVPLNGMYGDYGYHSQMVYSQAILEEAGLPAGAKITAITFYTDAQYPLSNPSGSENNPLTIKLGQPQESTLPSFVTDNLTIVSTTGNIWSGTTSVTLEFDSDKAYTYDGGNLLIDVSWAYFSRGYYKSIYWLARSATSASRYANNSSSGVEQGSSSGNYLPKITFTYEAGSVEPVTSGEVLTTNLEFNTYAGVAKTGVVSIKNTGNQPFTPTFSTLSAPFGIEAATEIPARQTKDFTVTYTPTAVGTDNGTLTVTINGTPTTVTLNGTANEAPLEVDAADGTDQNSYLPINGWTYDYKQINQMIYPASELAALAGKNITSVKFYSPQIKYSGGKYNVSLGLSDQSTYTASPSRITGLTTVKTGLVAEPTSGETELTITFDQPFTYEVGKNLIVEFEVTEAGQCDPSYNNLTYFYGKNQSVNTSYNSYCTYGTSYNATARQFLPKATFSYSDSETPATPVITVDPATVDAFTTEVGKSVTTTVNVSGENLTGDITATVSGTNADCFTAALENGVLTITYNPTAAGNHTATLTLSSTGAQDVTIALTGTATAPAVDYAVTMSDNSGAHNFGNVLVDNTKVWTLTVTNNGTQAVTPTLSGIEAPFSTNYTATALAAGESATIAFTFAPTEVNEYSNTITISFPEAGDAIAAYTCQLTGKAVNSFEPTAENEVVKLITVDKRSIYVPDFVDEANGNTTPQQLNCYDMRFKMAQLDDPAKRIKAGDLRPGNNLFEFYAIDDFGTEFRFATINLYAEGQPSSNPSVNAMDAPIKVTPSVEYYTEEGMPVHSTYTHNTELKYTEKTYNDVNDVVDLEGVIDYVNDTWSANTATNSHPDHYKFQIRGVGQFGDVVTSLTAEYVKGHMTGYGNSLVEPEGWYRSSWVGPNNEYDDDHVYQDTYYFYDLYISKEWLDNNKITGPVTVVINTTLSGSGFNADNYKTITVNGVEQIIAKEKFKDYSWTVPLVDEPVTIYNPGAGSEVINMGIIISSISGGSDFNKTKSITIYGGGTGVSNVDTVGIYKSSMNVKAYTQKQVDEDTDRSLVAMNAGAQTDVNVLAYGDPAVTGYKLYKNTSASTSGITADNHVASANHEIGDDVHRYVVNSTGTYNGSYNFVRDESLGDIDGMWLPMYPAAANEYYLPVTWANGIGDDGVVRSENNTYGSAMQQVEKNGSVDFASTSKCIKSDYTWVKDGVEYAIYNPVVDLTSTLPAETGYQLYNYRLWVDYDDNEPAWDYDQNLQFIGKMDRPLYSGTETHIGATGQSGQKDECAFAAPNNLEQVKLVARFYYKKTSTSTLKARPTDKDRLYYVVENQLTIPMSQIVTGVEDVTNKAVAGVMYYNLAGMQSEEPFSGVNIVVTRYTDGSISTAKVLK